MRRLAVAGKTEVGRVGGADTTVRQYAVTPGPSESVRVLQLCRYAGCRADKNVSYCIAVMFADSF